MDLAVAERGIARSVSELASGVSRRANVQPELADEVQELSRVLLDNNDAGSPARTRPTGMPSRTAND